MSTRPYHIPCAARQAIAYTMPWRQDHSIYHTVLTRPYHTPFLPRQAIYHAHQAIPYTMPNTMPCLTGHNHIPCEACQAIPRTMRCPPGHTIPYEAMRCPPGHTIPCEARKAIPYLMPGSSEHTIIPCNSRQPILYTMRGPPGCTIHHAMSARPTYIPYHARKAISYHITGNIIYHAVHHAMPARP